MTATRNFRRAFRALLRAALRALRTATTQPELLPDHARYYLVRALLMLELALDECSESAWIIPTNATNGDLP